MTAVRHPAALPALLAVPATCLAVLLSGIAIGQAPAEVARAWPTVGPAGIGPRAALLLALAAWGTAGVALLLAAARLRGSGREGAFAALILVYPLIFAFLWFLTGPDARTLPMVLVGGLLAVSVGLLIARGPRRGPGSAPLPRPWMLASDGALVLLPALLGLIAGARPDLRAAAWSFPLYPLFAAAQLAIFMVLPAPRLRALGLGPWTASGVCALLFALFHWPHPLVMAATGLGMLLWCRAWLGGRPFWQLALVMGLAATTFSQFLPDAWTGHVRIGPVATRTAAVEDLAMEPPGAAAPARAWLQHAYPRTVGRKPQAAELARWELSLVPFVRAGVAWSFLTSTEFRKRAAAAGQPVPPAGGPWAESPAPWPETVRAYADPARWPAGGDSFDRYLTSLYRDILGRDPAPAELSLWTEDLTPGQRRHLARWLLHHRHELATAPFDTATVADLMRPPRGLEIVQERP